MGLVALFRSLPDALPLFPEVVPRPVENQVVLAEKLNEPALYVREFLLVFKTRQLFSHLLGNNDIFLDLDQISMFRQVTPEMFFYFFSICVHY